MTSASAVSAVRNAIRLRGRVGTALHSDRGAQIRPEVFVQTHRSSGLTGSMGRVGTGGNAAVESFFALLKKDVLDRPRWATMEDLRFAIVAWIERTYHRRRRQRALGKVTPVEFEILGQAAPTAA